MAFFTVVAGNWALVALRIRLGKRRRDARFRLDNVLEMQDVGVGGQAQNILDALPRFFAAVLMPLEAMALILAVPAARNFLLLALLAHLALFAAVAAE